MADSPLSDGLGAGCCAPDRPDPWRSFGQRSPPAAGAAESVEPYGWVAAGVVELGVAGAAPATPLWTSSCLPSLVVMCDPYGASASTLVSVRSIVAPAYSGEHGRLDLGLWCHP